MSTLRTLAIPAAGLLLAGTIVRRRRRRPVRSLDIGSQSTGSGAGKVTFNPFSVRRKSSGGDTSGFTLNIGGAESAG